MGSGEEQTDGFLLRKNAGRFPQQRERFTEFAFLEAGFRQVVHRVGIPSTQFQCPEKHPLAFGCFSISLQQDAELVCGFSVLPVERESTAEERDSRLVAVLAEVQTAECRQGGGVALFDPEDLLELLPCLFEFPVSHQHEPEQQSGLRVVRRSGFEPFEQGRGPGGVAASTVGDGEREKDRRVVRRGLVSHFEFLNGGPVIAGFDQSHPEESMGAHLRGVCFEKCLEGRNGFGGSSGLEAGECEIELNGNQLRLERESFPVGLNGFFELLPAGEDDAEIAPELSRSGLRLQGLTEERFGCGKVAALQRLLCSGRRAGSLCGCREKQEEKKDGKTVVIPAPIVRQLQ